MAHDLYNKIEVKNTEYFNHYAICKSLEGLSHTVISGLYIYRLLFHGIFRIPCW